VRRWAIRWTKYPDIRAHTALPRDPVELPDPAESSHFRPFPGTSAAHLAGECLQPLGHLSGGCNRLVHAGNAESAHCLDSRSSTIVASVGQIVGRMPIGGSAPRQGRGGRAAAAFRSLKVLACRSLTLKASASSAASAQSQTMRPSDASLCIDCERPLAPCAGTCFSSGARASATSAVTPPFMGKGQFGWEQASDLRFSALCWLGGRRH